MARLLYFLFIFFPAGAFAQAIVSGRVLNQADHKPIPDASVFLNNSSVGAKTANDGTFYLKNVKPGKYQLIVSVIGFEKYDQAVVASNGNITLADIFISPKTIQLGEVTINSAPDENRQKYYSWFKDEFLGASGLAADCKINNPEILNLRYNKRDNALMANSTDFLIIENDALGYKIKYLLTNFTLNKSPATKFHLKYEGSALFEELQGTPSQEKRWQKRRLKVYNGSLMQFLRCSLNNTFEQAGFRVYPIDNRLNPKRPQDSLVTNKVKAYQSLALKSARFDDSLNYWQTKAALPEYIQTLYKNPLPQTDFITLTDQKGVYALNGKKGSLLVIDNRINTSDDSETLDDVNSAGNNSKTIINFTAGHSLFDKNGSLADPASLSLDGAWGNDRVAELLPVDFDPSQNDPAETDKEATNAAENELTGDPANLKTSLLALKSKSDSADIKIIPEKLYLQFDKPYYAVGDTIWFKAYLVNNFLMPSQKSAILNIDIANDSDKVIKQFRFPVQGGLTWGNIGLSDKDFKQGTYTLRAYTNWIRNFGNDCFFYKSINIISANSDHLLVNAAFGNPTINGAPSVEAKLRFTTMAGLPFAVQPITLQVMNADKHLYQQKYLTGVDGGLDVNFIRPQKPANLTMVVGNDKKERLAVIPVPLKQPENADVQFLPEGGSLIAGLPAYIAFKAIGEDGKRIDISGIVTDHAQKQLAVFKSLHDGMGSFDMTIAEGESYTAQVTLPGGAVKQYALPQVKNSGAILSIKNEVKSDSLYLTAAASKDIAASGQSFFLIGRARGIVCYAAIVNFHEGSSMSKKVAKSLFPTGVAHFTLMTAAYQPVNERLVFIDHADQLNVKLSADKPYYGVHDSVALKLRVTDSDGDPVSGNFSMAVTDDGQVKPDSVNEENISTRLLLTADLKGYIEDPGYYLSGQSPVKWQALDNLLLTQGWVGYDWAQVFNPPAIVYKPDREFAVTGHVFNVLNKPVKGTSVMLFSKSPSILMDTLTDKDGQFVFDHLPRVDTPLFVLKAVNKGGKSFNVSVKIDEIPAPDFKTPANSQLMPWYVNIDSALIAYTKNADAVRLRQDIAVGGHLLKEVKVTAKKMIKGSENLNGPGNADVVLDEKDLENSGKKTFRQLFEENIKGFREVYHGIYAWYYIYDKPIILIVNGIRIDQLYNIFDFKQYIEFHDAEDIKGMEVIYSDQYAANYVRRFLPSWVPIDAIAFIEITTRSGSPFIQNTPGMYLYKTLPLSWPKAFYKPKYTIKDTAQNHLDLRSTIDWEPNIITDANGEATVWFYTADKPSTYNIAVEGTDMNGRLGYKLGIINVESNKEKTR